MTNRMAAGLPQAASAGLTFPPAGALSHRLCRVEPALCFWMIFFFHLYSVFPLKLFHPILSLASPPGELAGGWMRLQEPSSFFRFFPQEACLSARAVHCPRFFGPPHYVPIHPNLLPPPHRSLTTRFFTAAFLASVTRSTSHPPTGPRNHPMPPLGAVRKLVRQ